MVSINEALKRVDRKLWWGVFRALWTITPRLTDRVARVRAEALARTQAGWPGTAPTTFWVLTFSWISVACIFATGLAAISLVAWRSAFGMSVAMALEFGFLLPPFLAAVLVTNSRYKALKREVKRSSAEISTPLCLAEGTSDLLWIIGLTAGSWAAASAALILV